MFDAIRKVHASARSAAALAYRTRMGIKGDIRIGVVVQRMVDAECAGVLFTKNPMTGADERVIEAAWGLGEVVVAGLVVPDRYRLDRSGQVLERVVGHKDLLLRPRSHADGGGTEEVTVAEGRVNAACLDDARLARLHHLASLCEAGSEGAHDIEWAFTAKPENEMFLLQRRAVTAFGGAL
jgi:pyruvate,water dikinase